MTPGPLPPALTAPSYPGPRSRWDPQGPGLEAWGQSRWGQEGQSVISIREGPEWDLGTRRNVRWSLSQLLGPLTLMVFNCANQKVLESSWASSSGYRVNKEDGMGGPKVTMGYLLGT